MDDLNEYLKLFAERGRAAGLDLKQPGVNWVASRDLAPKSHVSLTVSRDQIQVNLNNEHDLDRSRFDRLFAERTIIAAAIGCPLAWEKKDGRKKTAVRATLDRGVADRASWDAQHDWAVGMMKTFERELGRRLGAQNGSRA